MIATPYLNIKGRFGLRCCLVRNGLSHLNIVATLSDNTKYCKYFLPRTPKTKEEPKY